MTLKERLKAYTGQEFDIEYNSVWHNVPEYHGKVRYIAHKRFTDEGDKELCSVTIYSFSQSTGLEQSKTFTDPETLSAKDKGFREFSILREQHDATLELSYREGRQKALELFESGKVSETFTGYMLKKKWPKDLGFLGCKLHPEDPNTLLVPLYNLKKELTGVQIIYHSGDKQYTLGTEKKGSFLQLGDVVNSSLIYVCEGVATGVTLHKVTRECVFVAFDSSNLGEVARNIKRHYPSSRIVIAADDDNKTPNTGLISAKKAADLCNGGFIPPKFDRGVDAISTDWNDLYCTTSEDTVRSQLASYRPTSHGFIDPLGYRGGTYYYTSSDNPQISPISEHSETDLLKIMPLPYWEGLYGEYDKQGKCKLNYPLIKSSLMESARRQGYFSEDKIRGLGVWRHEGETIVHLGSRLWVSGTIRELTYFGRKHLYEFSGSQYDMPTRSLDSDGLETVREILSLLNVESDAERIYLGGWLMSAQLCGSLSWRPHVSIMGQAGSGKSTILKEFILPILGGYKVLTPQSSSTEAGLRQALGAHAIPVLFDEFESDTQKSTLRLQSVLELFRQASFDSSGSILKGSPSGEAMQFMGKFSGLVSAISPKILKEADVSRFSAIELLKSSQDPEKFKKIRGLLEKIDDNFAREYFLRNVQKLPAYLESIVIFESTLGARGKAARYSQQHAPLLAGFHLLFSDHAPTLIEAEELVTRLLDASRLYESGDIVLEGSDADAVRCLTHLLEYRVRVTTSDDKTIETPVLSLLTHNLELYKPGQEVSYWENHPRQRELKQLGISLGAMDGKTFIKIPPTNVQLAGCYRDTQFDGQWNTYLKRYPGAFVKRVRVFGYPAQYLVHLPFEFRCGEQETSDKTQAVSRELIEKY